MKRTQPDILTQFVSPLWHSVLCFIWSFFLNSQKIVKLTITTHSWGFIRGRHEVDILRVNPNNNTLTYGVFTLAWSGTGTGTGTGTGIMQNLSHCTGTWKNGLYGFNKNLSHCTWTGTGKNTSINHREHFQDLKNGYQTHSSGPENVPGVLPCPCSGAVWKVLIKTIQPILSGPCPCPGPGSGPSQCEYTIRVNKNISSNK